MKNIQFIAAETKEVEEISKEIIKKYQEALNNLASL